MLPRNQLPEDSRHALGAAITFFRDEKRLTMAQLAERADLAALTVENIEKGKTEPRWGTVRRIAYGLEVPLEEIVAEADRRESADAGASE